MTFGVKVKVKIKFNESVKLLNIDLLYQAAGMKALHRIVFEISVLVCIKNLKFNMATKISNMADRQTEKPHMHTNVLFISVKF